MSQVGGELGNKIKLADLSGRVMVSTGVQCECEGFVVGLNVELTSFHKMPEMLNGHVHCQELSVKDAVAGSWWFQFLGEEKD